MSGSVCFCVCVCGRGRSRKQVGGDRGMNFVLFMVHGGSWGTEDRILDFFGFIFCWFLIFFCLYLWNDSHLKKIVKFFGGDKIVQKELYLQGWFTKRFLLSQTSLSYVLKNVQSIVLLAIQLNGPWLKHPVKSFNEWMTYFYLIGV